MKALEQLLPILLLVVLLFLLVIRPARKRARHVSKLQANLSPGDEVMLTSGIFGTVTAMVDDRVHVTVADGVVLTCHRGAIAEIVRDVPDTGDNDDLLDESDHHADPAETAGSAETAETPETQAAESPSAPDASSRGAN